MHTYTYIHACMHARHTYKHAHVYCLHSERHTNIHIHKYVQTKNGTSVPAAVNQQKQTKSKPTRGNQHTRGNTQMGACMRKQTDLMSTKGCGVSVQAIQSSLQVRNHVEKRGPALGSIHPAACPVIAKWTVTKMGRWDEKKNNTTPPSSHNLSSARTVRAGR